MNLKRYNKNVLNKKLIHTKMNKKIFLVHNNIKKYIGEFDMDNKNEIEVKR